MLRLDLQIPVFMLQHNGHFIRETFMQMRGNGYAGGLRFKSNVEMMVAGQAVQCNITEYATDNSAQCLLHYIVIGNQTVRTLFTHCCLVDCEPRKIKTLVVAKCDAARIGQRHENRHNQSQDERNVD